MYKICMDAYGRSLKFIDLFSHVFFCYHVIGYSTSKITLSRAEQKAIVSVASAVAFQLLLTAMHAHKT